MKTDKDSFYQYAVRLFNHPIACKGEVDGDDKGEERKMIVFSFANGATYSAEALPPETGIDKLQSPGGFPNDEEARSFIKRYSEKTGAHIDWSKSKERREVMNKSTLIGIRMKALMQAST